jgi:hypothetical protein
VSRHHGATISEGVDKVKKQLRIDDDREKDRLPRINANEPKVAREVHFKPDDFLTGVLETGTDDGIGDIIHCGKSDLPWSPTIPLLRDPLVDPAAEKGTVRNDPAVDTVLLNHSTQRSDSNLEGKKMTLEATNKATMSQFFLDISIDIIAEFAS